MAGCVTGGTGPTVPTRVRNRAVGGTLVREGSGGVRVGSEVAIIVSWVRVLTGKLVVATGFTVTVRHGSQIHENTFRDTFHIQGRA